MFLCWSFGKGINIIMIWKLYYCLILNETAVYKFKLHLLFQTGLSEAVVWLEQGVQQIVQRLVLKPSVHQ